MVPKKLMQKLESAEMSLSDVKQRYLLLHAFQNEFDELVGRRQISLLNDHVWQMVLDTRDALALHLASWTKGLTSPGGLLGEMKFSLSHLYVPSPDPGSRRPADRREVFERLFPEAVRRKKVLASDIDAFGARHQEHRHPSSQ